MTDGIDAGELDRRIVILSAQRTDDGFSKDRADADFTPIDGRWAKRTDVKDGERIAAASQGQTLTTRFLVRWDRLTAVIDGTYRIECEGVTYEVVATKEARGRRVGVEITCTTIVVRA